MDAACKVDGIDVDVDRPAMTVADCCEFRSTLGVDVALDALGLYLQRQSSSTDELMRSMPAAGRIATVTRPCVEVLDWRLARTRTSRHPPGSNLENRMHILVERVGPGWRILLDRDCMAKIGIAATDADVVDVAVVDDALVIRKVPDEHRAAAMKEAEAARDERERRWQETMRRPRGHSVEPT